MRGRHGPARRGTVHRRHHPFLFEDTDPGRAQELIEAVAFSGEPELAQVARALLDELLDEGPDH